MVKGSFIVGVRHGKGVIVMRNAACEWLAPAFVNATGGSVGLQAGCKRPLNNSHSKHIRHGV